MEKSKVGGAPPTTKPKSSQNVNSPPLEKAVPRIKRNKTEWSPENPRHEGTLCACVVGGGAASECISLSYDDGRAMDTAGRERVPCYYDFVAAVRGLTGWGDSSFCSGARDSSRVPTFSAVEWKPPLG
ncbi:hypothetical protein NL676_036090 [Syzygium grande]|nr:hypothetical protein NL676_036090 [Syzygium grande]